MALKIWTETETQNLLKALKAIPAEAHIKRIEVAVLAYKKEGNNKEIYIKIYYFYCQTARFWWYPRSFICVLVVFSMRVYLMRIYQVTFYTKFFVHNYACILTVFLILTSLLLDLTQSSLHPINYHITFDYSSHYYISLAILQQSGLCNWNRFEFRLGSTPHKRNRYNPLFYCKLNTFI